MPIIKRPSDKWGSLEEIKEWYRKEKNSKLSTRLNAIRLLMMGYSRKDASKILGVGESTVGDWRRKWDHRGKEGLKSNHKGSRSKINSTIRVDIEEMISVKKEINGRIVTGKLIHGYIKKIQNKNQLFSGLLCYKIYGV